MKTFRKTLNPWTERSEVPSKHSKVSYSHFDCGRLETNNYPPSSLLGSQAACFQRSSLLNNLRCASDLSVQEFRVFWKCFHQTTLFPPIWEWLDWPHTVYGKMFNIQYCLTSASQWLEQWLCKSWFITFPASPLSLFPILHSLINVPTRRSMDRAPIL